MKPLEIACVFIVIAIIVLVFVNINTNEKRNIAESKLQHMLDRDSVNLRKQGSTSLCSDGKLGEKFINYDLRSWDGGQNWYAVDHNLETKEVKILGTAEEIYPGLLDCLNGWNRLTDHVIKNGPIGSKPITDKDIEVLEGAGFTVKQNEDSSKK